MAPLSYTDTWEFDTTASGPSELRLAFRDAVATKYAKTVAGKFLDTSRLTAVQFAYSKFGFDGGLNPSFQEGRFTLRLDKLALYR